MLYIRHQSYIDALVLPLNIFSKHLYRCRLTIRLNYPDGVRNYLMKHPFISIIIPVLNGENTIFSCLESIEFQVFTDYEVVIIDGGSTDGTLDIIHSFMSIPIQLVLEPGISIYGGMNKGIERSTGHWLYFMGCDDALCSENTFLEVASILSKTIASVVVGHVIFSNGFMAPPLLGSPLMLRFRPHHQGMFYSRTLFTTYQYNERWWLSADYDLSLRLKADQVVFRGMPVIVAVYSDSGLSRRNFEQGFAEMRQIHRLHFSGPARWWVMVYGQVLQHIFRLRDRYGLLNLRVRLAKFAQLPFLSG